MSSTANPQGQSFRGNVGETLGFFRSSLLGITILLSAFLLFQVQPLAGKAILPWFGGSAAVWTACLLFFQAALLLGYLYAHLVTTLVPPKTQVAIHSSLLLASLLTLPIIPSARWKPAGPSDPLARIFELLFSTVGLTYVLLSATSPLLQSWVSRLPNRKSPYRLFSLSNLGSLLGLLTFPVIVEPYLTGIQQAWMWSAAYAAFAILCVTAGLTFRTAMHPGRLVTDQVAPASTIDMFFWCALSASGSALLLAVSHHITQNIASIPLLWVIPLALYLVTYIAVFAGPSWHPRSVLLPLFAVSIAAMAYLLYSYADDDGLQTSYEKSYITLLISFSAAFFFCCLALHGELARRKPDASRLTSYYLTISAGGALGALFVAWAAPRIFPAPWELPLLLIVCPILVLAACGLPRSIAHKLLYGAAAAGILAGTLFLSYQTYTVASHLRRMTRNFYGALRTFDTERVGLFALRIRRMDNGNTTHGEQILNAGAERTPTTYYGRQSGIGLAIEAKRGGQPLSIGLVGLGAGTLAAYSEPGDKIKFYEVNENVVRLATEEFTYLQNSRAPVQIVMGDARLSLEQEPDQKFDVLAIDAFNGDAVPVHLITREALMLYSRHLKPNGTLALHLSNRHLNLQPVTYIGLRNLGWGTFMVSNVGIAAEDVLASDWLLANRVPEYFRIPIFIGKSIPIEDDGSVVPWTDNYSSIWKILR